MARYLPQTLSAPDWAQIAGEAHCIVRLTNPTGLDTIQHLLGAAAALTAMFPGSSVASLLTDQNIEVFCRDLADRRSLSTNAHVRGRLYRLMHAAHGLPHEAVNAVKGTAKPACTRAHRARDLAVFGGDQPVMDCIEQTGAKFTRLETILGHLQPGSLNDYMEVLRG